MFGIKKMTKNKGIDDIFVEIEVEEESPKFQHTYVQTLVKNMESPTLQDTYTQNLIKDMERLKVQYPDFFKQPYVKAPWYDKYKDAEVEALASTDSLGLYTPAKVNYADYAQQDAAAATYDYYRKLQERMGGNDYYTRSVSDVRRTL